MSFLGEKYLLTSESAFAIYSRIKDLPIVDPHNHADVAEIAANKNYPNPWQLFAATDHYVWEVLRKRGVPEQLITGDADPKDKWLKMSEVFPTIAGNPVYEWVHLDLKRYLGIETVLDNHSGEDIWEQASAVLSVPSKRPQELLRQIGVETMCSTDDPIDTLENHDKVNQAFGRKLILPTWRPDKALNIFAPAWREYIDKLGVRFDKEITDLGDLVEALRQSHDYFAEKGCVVSDHGLEMPLAGNADAEPLASEAFKKAISGETLTMEERISFMSFLLGEMAEMDAAKNWVFQIHLGAVRDVRDSLFADLGPDTGGDVSNHFIDILKPLTHFLNRFDDRLKVVLYCLDPSHQPTLATTARAFGANVALGSAWWLCDTPIGMKRQLEYIGTVDVLSNFAGMVSDSRKLLSYGSRFEMFRRVLADVLGNMDERGQMSYKVAEDLAVRVCYDGPKEFFNL